MKTVAVIFCLSCYYFSHAQLSIDSIKTEADIETFVKQYESQNWPDWKVNFYNQSDNSYKAESNGRPDSNRYSKWIIADFNNDGKKDLIFSNINNYSDKSNFFSLLSNSKGNYDQFNIWKHYHYYYSFSFDLVQEGKHNYLLLNENKFNLESVKPVRFIKTTILMAAFGGFVEKLNFPRAISWFDTLQFRFSYFPYLRSMMTLPQGMMLTILKDGKAIYEEDGNLYSCDECFDPQGGAINTTVHLSLSEDEKQEVTGMLRLSDFSKKHYVDTLGGFHLDQAFLKIRYGRGVKQITDNGLEGTYWLKLFYKKMFIISTRIRKDMAGYFLRNHFELYQ